MKLLVNTESIFWTPEIVRLFTSSAPGIKLATSSTTTRASSDSQSIGQELSFSTVHVHINSPFSHCCCVIVISSNSPTQLVVFFVKHP